jgi:putative NADH-flavin reductase
MKLLIIGGTGKTGRELIKQGLEQKHIITAIVRNPAKMQSENLNLKVIKGILDYESIENAFQNQDAALSALGHKRFIIKTNILSEGTKNIIRAMGKHGVKRFICITSLGINDSRFKLGLYYTFFIIPVILFLYFRDKSKQEKIIMKSNLDWTIVRPGQLTNGKKLTRYKHGENVGNYILTKMISRADTAHFMLSQLEDITYIHKTPGITI